MKIEAKQKRRFFFTSNRYARCTRYRLFHYLCCSKTNDALCSDPNRRESHKSSNWTLKNNEKSRSTCFKISFFFFHQSMTLKKRKRKRTKMELFQRKIRLTERVSRLHKLCRCWLLLLKQRLWEEDVRFRYFQRLFQTSRIKSEISLNKQTKRNVFFHRFYFA